MDEFLKLYLTGKRAEDLKRCYLIRTIVGLVGAAVVLIPVFLNIFGIQNPPLSIALTVVGLLLEGDAAFLTFVFKKFAEGLVELENAAIEIEKEGEERENYRRLYAAWREVFGARDRSAVFSVLFTVLSYAILGTTVLLGVYVELPDYVLPVACLAAGVVMSIPFFLKVGREMTVRTRLYELAGGELDEIKRSKFGVSEGKIAAEAENARGASMLPLPVAMFLKDGTEREEFRAVNKRSAWISFFYGFAIGAGLIIMTISGLWDKSDPIVTWTVVLVAIFVLAVVFFALMLPLEAKKKDIYQRNYGKLTDSRADVLRRDLQGAWIKSQRRGNLMFLSFLLLPLVIGIAIGIAGYAMGKETSMIVAIGEAFVAFLVPAAIVSLIIWIVMYALYRRRARPKEIELRSETEEERRNERQG